MAEYSQIVEQQSKQTDRLIFTYLWKRKIKTIFCCLDADKNGKFNRGDLNILARRFQQFGKLSNEDRDVFARDLTQWYDALHSKSSTHFEQFLQDITAMFTVMAKEDIFVRLRPILVHMFKAIDVDGTGMVSITEWKLFHKAMDIHNDRDTEASFQVVDAKRNGKLSYEEFIAGAFDFFYSQENSANCMFFGPMKEL